MPFGDRTDQCGEQHAPRRRSHGGCAVTDSSDDLDRHAREGGEQRNRGLGGDEYPGENGLKAAAPEDPCLPLGVMVMTRLGKETGPVLRRDRLGGALDEYTGGLIPRPDFLNCTASAAECHPSSARRPSTPPQEAGVAVESKAGLLWPHA